MKVFVVTSLLVVFVILPTLIILRNFYPDLSPINLILISFVWLIYLFILACFVYQLSDVDVISTFTREGESKIIYFLDAYYRTVFSYTNHDQNIDGDIIELPPGQKSSGRGQGFLGQGWHWVGLPPFFKVKDTVSLKDQIQTLRLEKAECRDNLPLTITYNLITRCVNPRKATTVATSWSELTIGFVNRSLREYIGSWEFAELFSDKTRLDQENLMVWLIRQGIIDQLVRLYGIKIVSCDIVMIDLSPKLEEIATKIYSAKQKSAELQIVAQGEAQALSTKREEIQKPGGELAIQAEVAKILASSPNNTIIGLVPTQVLNFLTGQKEKKDDQDKGASS